MKIQNYFSEVGGSLPTAENLEVGQLWINLADGKIGTKNNANSILEWSQFSPSEKTKALNSISKTGTISGISYMEVSETVIPVSGVISVESNTSNALTYTLTAEPLTVKVAPMEGRKTVTLTLIKPENVTTTITWEGLSENDWMSSGGAPAFGASQEAQELCVAFFLDPNKCLANVLYNTENPEEAASDISWGDIGGTLDDQADLKAALAGKANTKHAHSEAEVTGLTAKLGTYALKTDVDSKFATVNSTLGIKANATDLTALEDQVTKDLQAVNTALGTKLDASVFNGFVDYGDLGTN